MVKKSQEIKYSFLEILTGSDLSRRRLHLLTTVSKKPGPVVWLTACSHGDEVAGIAVVQEIFKIIQKKPLQQGSLYALPLMNPLGFETVSRNITFSQEDLNRSFPGNKKGSLAERIAEKIFTSIKQTRPTLVLDLHNDWKNSIPHTFLDPRPAACQNKTYQKTKIFSQKAGFLIILDTTNEFQKNLSYNLLKKNIPALTLELGEPCVVNEKNVKLGVKAVLNLLTDLKMLKLEKETLAYNLPKTLKGKILKYSYQPVSSTSGLIRFLVKPGVLVKKGQPMAKIYNIFGELQETITAEKPGVVLGHCDSAAVFPGMPVISLGIL